MSILMCQGLGRRHAELGTGHVGLDSCLGQDQIVDKMGIKREMQTLGGRDSRGGHIYI